MKHLKALCGITATIVNLASSGAAQQLCELPREMRAAVENLNFAEGIPDSPPPGWFLGPEWFMPPHPPIYEAKTASGVL